jgi:hypothetical protein
MTTSLGRRLHALASALVAAGGLLFFDWSPTGVLLLFWLETVVLVLAPLLAAIALILVRREGLAAGAVLLLLVLMLAVFLGGQAFVISVLGLFERGHVTDLHGTTLAVPLYEPLVATFADRSFLVGAATVVAFALGDLWPRFGAGAKREPSSGTAAWPGSPFTRILVAQFALIVGGGLIILTQLPSAAALLLVALKLWLDLRDARSGGAAPEALRSGGPSARG